MPFEWIVSRICEEFNCLPSQAVDELMNDPRRMALEILRLRSYAHAKYTLETATTARDIPKGVNVDQVLEIQKEIMERGGQDGEHCGIDD
jgi:hypothetical protein